MLIRARYLLCHALYDRKRVHTSVVPTTFRIPLPLRGVSNLHVPHSGWVASVILSYFLVVVGAG